MMPDNFGSWANYRLGDFFLFPEGKKRYKKFPGTIIHEYYQRTSEPSNYKILSAVIDDLRSTRKIEIPRTDCCVIHLRTGDVINNSEFTVDEFFSKKRYYVYDHHKHSYIKKQWNQYVKTREYYERVAKKLKRLDIKQVSFPCNFNFQPYTFTRTRNNRHSKDDFKSIDYAQRVYDLFAKESFDVVKHEGHDVDYDFTYMCNSSFFVPSGGGLSRIISRMIKLKGKKVVKGEW